MTLLDSLEQGLWDDQNCEKAYGAQMKGKLGKGGGGRPPINASVLNIFKPGQKAVVPQGGRRSCVFASQCNSAEECKKSCQSSQ